MRQILRCLACVAALLLAACSTVDIAPPPQGEGVFATPESTPTAGQTSGLQFVQAHIFLEFNVPGTLWVTQLYLVRNPGDKPVTAVRAGDPVLTFSLPDGAANLQFAEGVLGKDYVQVAGGFGAMTEIAPGEVRKVLFGYDLPYTDGLVFDLLMNDPYQSVVLLMPAVGVDLQSDRLRFAGEQRVENDLYKVYAVEGVKAGDRLSFTLSGIPERGRAQGTSTGLIVGGAALLLVLAGIGIWLVRFNRRSRVVTQDKLLDSLIALDDLRAAGKIDAAQYERRQKAIKTQLYAFLQNRHD